MPIISSGAKDPQARSLANLQMIIEPLHTYTCSQFLFLAKWKARAGRWRMGMGKLIPSRMQSCRQHLQISNPLNWGYSFSLPGFPRESRPDLAGGSRSAPAAGGTWKQGSCLRPVPSVSRGVAVGPPERCQHYSSFTAPSGSLGPPRLLRTLWFPCRYYSPMLNLCPFVWSPDSLSGFNKPSPPINGKRRGQGLSWAPRVSLEPTRPWCCHRPDNEDCRYLVKCCKPKVCRGSSSYIQYIRELWGRELRWNKYLHLKTFKNFFKFYIGV